MKRVLLILAVSLSMLTGCSSLTKSFQDIKATSCNLVSVTPQGLNALNAVIELGIDNPTIGFTVSDFTGLVKMSGDSVMVITADTFKVEGHESKTYQIPLQGQLADGFNPFKLLTLMGSKKNLESLTADVSARVTLPGGIGKNLEYKDLPLSSLVDKL